MSTAAPSAQVSPTTRPRVDLFDGLRGIALVLVVLSHGWTLWPTDWVDNHWWVRPVFRSGNSAVTVFLVVAGFLTYRSLSGRSGLQDMRPAVALLRRIVRVGPSLWLMMLVLMLVAAIDPTDTTARQDNVTSVLHVVTYTWNWYVQGNLVTSRPDFGHLWYLSVDMQAFVIMSLLLYMMRRRTVGLIALLVAFYLLLSWWRFHVTGTENVFQVLVRTTARMDAFVIGVLAAAAVPLLVRLDLPARRLSQTALGCLVLLVPLVWWCAADPGGSGDTVFLGWGGTLLQLTLATLLVSVILGGRPAATDVLAHPRLVFLGQRSLLVYIWHYPVFVFVQRHSDGWAWPLRALVALLLTVAVCVVGDLVLERRVTRLLRHPWWHRLDHGLASYGRDSVRGRLARPRPAAGRRRQDA